MVRFNRLSARARVHRRERSIRPEGGQGAPRGACRYKGKLTTFLQIDQHVRRGIYFFEWHRSSTGRTGDFLSSTLEPNSFKS